MKIQFNNNISTSLVILEEIFNQTIVFGTIFIISVLFLENNFDIFAVFSDTSRFGLIQLIILIFLTLSTIVAIPLIRYRFPTISSKFFAYLSIILIPFFFIVIFPELIFLYISCSIYLFILTFSTTLLTLNLYFCLQAFLLTIILQYFSLDLGIIYFLLLSRILISNTRMLFTEFIRIKSIAPDNGKSTSYVNSSSVIPQSVQEPLFSSDRGYIWNHAENEQYYFSYLYSKNDQLNKDIVDFAHISELGKDNLLVSGSINKNCFMRRAKGEDFIEVAKNYSFTQQEKLFAVENIFERHKKLISSWPASDIRDSELERFTDLESLFISRILDHKFYLDVKDAQNNYGCIVHQKKFISFMSETQLILPFGFDSRHLSYWELLASSTGIPKPQKQSIKSFISLRHYFNLLSVGNLSAVDGVYWTIKAL